MLDAFAIYPLFVPYILIMFPGLLNIQYFGAYMLKIPDSILSVQCCVIRPQSQ